MGFRAQRQSLPQLPQLRLFQLLFEFWLSYKNNLQQFLGEGLEVGQHADLFQHFVGEVLCLIDDQNRSFPGPVTVQQPVVQPQQDLALCLRVAWNPEVRHHVIQKLRHVQARVEDECRGHLLQAQPLEQLIDERGLAGSHLACQQDEPFAALDSVGQAC